MLKVDKYFRLEIIKNSIASHQNSELNKIPKTLKVDKYFRLEIIKNSIASHQN